MSRKRPRLSDAEYGRNSRIFDWHAGLRWRDKKDGTYEGRDFLIEELKRLPKNYKNVRRNLINYLQEHYGVVDEGNW